MNQDTNPTIASPRVHVLTVPGFSAERDAVAQSLADLGACVHADPERRGVLRNTIEAWRCGLNSDDPWVTVLQDDVVLYPDWPMHLRAAQRFSPRPFLGLTHFGKYGQGIARKGAAYGVGRAVIWGGASTYQRSSLLGLVEFADWAERAGYWSSDGVVTAYHLWCLSIGTPDAQAKSAVTARAVFGQADYRSTLGHSRRSEAYPRLTIENAGPPWHTSSAPVAVSVSPSTAARTVAFMRLNGTPERIYKGRSKG